MVSLSLGLKKGTEYAEYYKKVQKQHREFIDCMNKRQFEKLKAPYKEHMMPAQARLPAYSAGHI